MSAPGWDHPESPFHPGEQAIQRHLGIRDRLERVGRRIIRDYMPDQHRAFYNEQPWLFLGHVDDEGWPWASVLTGAPGFMTTPTARTLHVDAAPRPGDPLGEALTLGRALGALGIDLATRRRNRLALTLAATCGEGFRARVDQTFGNCPQYIHKRPLNAATPGGAPARVIHDLDDDLKAFIAEADTLFVASAAGAQGDGPTLGADVSHRGGPRGFVELDDQGRLVVPDYRGNNHFNTLGNFALYPRGGLLFIDFDTGDLLQLTGEVELLWAGPEVARLDKAERAWRFTPRRGYWHPGALPLRLKAADPRPLSG